ncbi:MAG: DUF2851 family protein [Cyclobacteriaceae bacterium]|nr:DUF2851 family protein [Cyclobacteriaceae bacterium]
MQESFLHYIWQFQYFDKKELTVSSGEKLEVFFPGTLNNDAGPDFVQAKVRLANMDWIGSVEIHVKSSGWYDHHHDVDGAYENVVLHVVWIEDKEVLRIDGTAIPTLVLKDRVDESLITRYQNLVQNPSAIPCEKLFPQVSDLVKHGMLDKALMQRLENKAEQIVQLLKATNNDWEEVTYQLMARNFGFKINYDPFFQLANAVRRKILLKHGDSLMQIEALLFGQAGFLEYGIKDEYFKELQSEYKVLAVKYGLNNQKLNKENWKFLRLRPANFPTIRIAQFSALFHKNRNFFSKLIEMDIDIVKLFEISTSSYWHSHYRFGRKTARSISNLGMESINNLIINTVVPLLVAYGKSQDDQPMIDRAVEMLHGIKAENNRITKSWNDIGLAVKDSFDSQALIELNNNFCLKRRCLACNIGIEILKPIKS